MSIEISHVSKSFGPVKAIDDLSLTLKEGTIYGLLGRNGAGKTTLLNMITGRLFPQAGSVSINGHGHAACDAAQQNVYFMSEQNLYPDTLRVRDVFKWTKRFYNGEMDLAEADRLAGLFGLDTKKKIRQLSTGYTSIFKIIIALSLKVPYLLLDEPVLGLDANHRELFYKLLIENYSNWPRTIVISTHLIEEVSTIIEQALIIKNGRLIKNESVETLLASGYTVSGPAGLVEGYIKGKQVIGEDSLGGLATACIQGQPGDEPPPPGLVLSSMDLQKLFIRLTNQ